MKVDKIIRIIEKARQKREARAYVNECFEGKTCPLCGTNLINGEVLITTIKGKSFLAKYYMTKIKEGYIEGTYFVYGCNEFDRPVSMVFEGIELLNPVIFGCDNARGCGIEVDFAFNTVNKED